MPQHPFVLDPLLPLGWGGSQGLKSLLQKEAWFSNSEEDKRATTNVQNGLVFFFLFSFILFYSLLLSLS